MNALKLESHAPPDYYPPMSLDVFMRETGLTAATLWRYRKKGWLRTENISGRHYVTRAEIQNFNNRLRSGEFAGEPTNPTPRKESVAGAAPEI